MHYCSKFVRLMFLKVSYTHQKCVQIQQKQSNVKSHYNLFIVFFSCILNINLISEEHNLFETDIYGIFLKKQQIKQMTILYSINLKRLANICTQVVICKMLNFLSLCIFTSTFHCYTSIQYVCYCRTTVHFINEHLLLPTITNEIMSIYWPPIETMKYWI